MEELAEQMLALDDLSEEAIRAKMEARALSGDRITALRLFEDWKIRLASELQAEPSETLRRMAARLRQTSWRHS
jgi:DNA-binding SARP family transcriptional activator